MSDILNLSNVSVDESGRVTVSGVSSGIDIGGTVDAIMAARRIPVDRLEAGIEANAIEIEAYTELSSLLNVLNQSVDALRGAVTFGNSGNAYETKQAFASGSRLDGGTASDAADLIGVTVTNDAIIGSHTMMQFIQAKPKPEARPPLGLFCDRLAGALLESKLVPDNGHFDLFDKNV